MQAVDSNMLPGEDPTQPIAYRMKDLLNEWDRFAEEAYETKQSNTPMGICTGLASVDEAIGGVFQPGLHSLQGPPGVGKSAFALQIAATCGFPALFVTCEQSPMEILRRITARVTGTIVNYFKNGDLTPELSRGLVRQAINTCPDLTILDCTRAYAGAFAVGNTRTSMNLYNIANSIRGESSHMLVMIDSLHTWASNAPTNSTEYDSLNAAIASLISLSASLVCPVVAVAEQPKDAVGKADVMSGAGTRKIGYSAESVMALDENRDGRPNLKSREKYITLKLTKNRNGTAGQKIELLFDGAVMGFQEA